MRRAARGRFVLACAATLLLSGLILLSTGVGLFASTLQASSLPTQPAPGQTLNDLPVNQNTTNDQQEPTLAVDPTNPNNVLAASKDWRTGPKQVWYYRSSDGGRTWNDGHVDLGASELPNQSDPVLAWDASGAAYLAFIGYNQNDLTVGGIFAARSEDAGKTWDKPSLVAAHADGVFNDKEWLTTDRSRNPSTKGNVYVTWTRFSKEGQNRERGDIVASRSTDGGKTFSAPVTINLPTQSDNQGSYPVVGPNGELYVLYYSEGDADRGGQTRGLYIARSTDGGLKFSTPVKAASVSRPVSPLPGSKFRVFVLPVLAVDPSSGALYAVWNDFRTDDTDVLLVRSTDGGNTWSDPVRVNNDPRTPRHDQFFPTVAVGADGTVHLLWLDRRDDPNNKLYRPYYAASEDGGKTFKQGPLTRTSSNPDVGFQGTLIGDYISLDTSADGSQVYAAWIDTRNGNQDIYFSSFPAKPGPGEPAPAVEARPTPVAVPSPQPLSGFSDAAFLRKWERTDRPVLLGRVGRSWTWGPVSFAAAREPYAQGQGGLRQVQYFDKARMEINHPNGNSADPFYVTNGLLVVELISGRVQAGDDQFEQRAPAQIGVAGDVNSPDALTYASLGPVASLNGSQDHRAQDRTGQSVTATLNRDGTVSQCGGPVVCPSTPVKLAQYEPTLGHNIPDVFRLFMNQKGLVQKSDPGVSPQAGMSEAGEEGEGSADPDRLLLALAHIPLVQEPVLDWVADLGYPLTEPYWTSVKINGVAKTVLVQAFQRRVLTYVADNPPGSQVEMGNVGRHYFDWRYR